VEERTLTFYYFFIQHTKNCEVDLDGNVYSTQGQAVSIAMTNVIKESAWFITVYCFFTVVV